MKKCVLWCFLLLLAGCNSSSNYLAQALQLAGDNRAELEKVLAHYENEPLKRQAAQFLIENMFGHYSYQNQAYAERYYDAFDSVNLYAGRSEEEIIARYKTVAAKYNHFQPVVSDLQIIKADYLIDNIDRAFDTWQNEPWATHLGFEEFCEYLLPYKVAECQTFDNWREYLSDTSYGNLQYLPYISSYNHSAYWACLTVHEKIIAQRPKDFIEVQVPPIRRIRSLTRMLRQKSCDDNNMAMVSIMRAKGIPGVIDFTPQQPNTRTGHSWTALLHNTGKIHPFDSYNDFGNPYINYPLAKIFRRYYAINPELAALNRSEKYVPDFLRDIHIKDVTGEYQRTNDITVKLDRHTGNYAYLAVFNDVYWNPIHFGKITGNKAVFKNMGRDVVYMPVCLSEQGGIVPAGKPFILTVRGEVKTITPDATRTQTLTLNRKHPSFRYTQAAAEVILGGKIQAANRADFGDAVTLHTIELYGTLPGEIRLDTLAKKYRYWRYYAPPKGFGNLAELILFQHEKNITGQGTIIGTNDRVDDLVKKHDNFTKKHAFDNDPLTFFESTDSLITWVGLDFGTPQHIDRIIYIPRTDGNIITYGDEYELKYWGNNGWISLGRKTADGVTLTFDHCPTGALFLLHDCTRGVEDRIFTYENGQQVWW
ncbi:MAG: hypothetical protein LBT48_00950 [Prevotellaceae bacterium]|jgi:hypothetical protein|nr:hypothetical protein [Prevotellaceae bacterium]